MKTIEALVSEHALFRDLAEGDLALIAGCGRNRVFEDGALLMREGDEANEFFALRSGKAALCLHLPAKGELVIETFGPGDVVGWSWLFPPYRVHFDVRAVGATHAVAFDGACLRGKAEAAPALGYTLMKRFAQVLIERLQATRMRLVDLYGAD